MPKPIFIAEIKVQSPFGFRSRYSFAALMELAIKYGDWISVHTHPLWGGGPEAVQFVRRYTNKIILAKGIHETDEEIIKMLDCGADRVLAVDRYPALPPEQLLLEFHNLDDITATRANLHTDGYSFVYNSRDLRTGNPKKDNWNEYRKQCKWLCQASGITHPNEVKKDADAFIVGERLVSFCTYL